MTSADMSDIKAAIKARGWTRLTCGEGAGRRHVIQTADEVVHSATYVPQNKRESILISYFLADQDERARVKPEPVDDWATLVQAMADEGFGWAIHRDQYAGDPTELTRVWVKDGSIHDCIRNAIDNPVEALRDLLTQARAKWPKPEPEPVDPWADLGTDELLAICKRRGWRMTMLPLTDNVWRVRPAGSMGEFLGMTLPDALFIAMHEFERREKAR